MHSFTPSFEDVSKLVDHYAEHTPPTIYVGALARDLKRCLGESGWQILIELLLTHEPGFGEQPLFDADPPLSPAEYLAKAEAAMRAHWDSLTGDPGPYDARLTDECAQARKQGCAFSAEMNRALKAIDAGAEAERARQESEKQADLIAINDFFGKIIDAQFHSALALSAKNPQWDRTSEIAAVEAEPKRGWSASVKGAYTTVVKAQKEQDDDSKAWADFWESHHAVIKNFETKIKRIAGGIDPLPITAPPY